MRRVHKFPLFTGGEWQANVQMPAGARIVHFDVQYVGPIGDKPRQGHPTVWALIDDAAEKETRRFAVIGTGRDVPPGARHIGSYQAEPFVGHVFELPEEVPRDVPTEAHRHYRHLVREGFVWAGNAWTAPADFGPLGHAEIIALTELEPFGYGTCRNA